MTSRRSSPPGPRRKGTSPPTATRRTSPKFALLLPPLILLAANNAPSANAFLGGTGGDATVRDRARPPPRWRQQQPPRQPRRPSLHVLPIETEPAPAAPPRGGPFYVEDGEYYSSNVPVSAAGTAVGGGGGGLGGAPGGAGQRITLTRFLNEKVQDRPELRDMESILLSVQMACKTISNVVNRAGINQLSPPRTASSDDDGARAPSDRRLNSMKRLDQLSANVLRNALRFTGKLQMVAPARETSAEATAEGDGPAEHQPGVLIASAIDGRYVACFDPLDGSGNADADICTGTVFGLFETPEEEEEEEDGDDDGADGGGGGDSVLLGGGGDGDNGPASAAAGGGGGSYGLGTPSPPDPDALVRSVLQPGRNLRAAGYCLYSSATILVFTLGEGTHGFTLDPQINEFVLTHPNIRIPPRGNVYSCNEANSEGWGDDLKAYLSALKSGRNDTKQRYALRYVGSMVGDIHRTLMYGGIFCYPADSDQHPRGNLQLLYKSAPMGYIVAQAGGLATDGRRDLLDVRPRRVHERSPCFIGSPDDVEEMKKYIKHEE